MKILAIYLILILSQIITQKTEVYNVLRLQIYSAIIENITYVVYITWAACVVWDIQTRAEGEGLCMSDTTSTWKNNNIIISFTNIYSV
jgi:hypothetical protein